MKPRFHRLGESENTMSEGYFASAQYVTPGVSDYVLREWLADNAAIDETGSVDEPGGHIALVEVTPEMIVAKVTEHGDPFLAANFEAGWYLILTDEHGFVWGHKYVDEDTARRDFGVAELLQAEQEEF